MFRWCSYCQTFIGQSEPHSDFSMTHGICSACKARSKTHDFDPTSLKPILDFYQALQSGFKNRNLEPEALLRDAKRLNLKAKDLLAGIIQPMLYEIGRLYETGKIQVSDEHEFTNTVKTLLFLVESQFENQIKEPGAQVLLACIEGEYHDLGIQFLRIALWDEGISCKAIYPSRPALEVLRLAKTLNSEVVGFSVTNPQTVLTLRSLPAMIKEVWNDGTHPHFILGGQMAPFLSIKDPQILQHDGSLKQLISLVQNRKVA